MEHELLPILLLAKHQMLLAENELVHRHHVQMVGFSYQRVIGHSLLVLHTLQAMQKVSRHRFPCGPVYFGSNLSSRAAN